MTKTKKEKQESFNEDVSFGSQTKNYSNISQAAEKFNKPIIEIDQGEKVDHSKQQGYERGIRIQVHRDVLARFFKLHKKYERAIFDENYETVDKKYFFKAVIDYYKGDLISSGSYKTAPDKFIATVTKKGRRRRTERVCTDENRDDSFFGMSNETYKNYYDIMYSFIKSDSSLDPTVFTTSYFFYDLTDYIHENIKDIIKKNIDIIKANE